MLPRTVVARLMGHDLGDQTFGGYSDGLNFEQYVQIFNIDNFLEYL